MAKKNDPPKKSTCPTCAGTGQYPIPHPSDKDKTVWTTCPWCHGTGQR